MTDHVPIVLAALNAISAFVYILVGRAVMRRHVSIISRPAVRAFALFWYGLSGIYIGSLILLLAHQLGAVSLALYLTYLQGVLLVIMAAVAGLLYYLVFVYTGRVRAWAPIATGYALLYIALLYAINVANPIGVIDTRWGPELAYETPLEDDPLTQVLGVLLTLPTLIAAGAYALLLRRVDNRSQRFRIASVAGGFIVWFGASFITGTLLDVDADNAASRLFNSLIAIFASIVVLMAFDPPIWLQKRLKIEGYAHMEEPEAGK